jgi:hypothetical protein
MEKSPSGRSGSVQGRDVGTQLLREADQVGAKLEKGNPIGLSPGPDQNVQGSLRRSKPGENFDPTNLSKSSAKEVPVHPPAAMLGYDGSESGILPWGRSDEDLQRTCTSSLSRSEQVPDLRPAPNPG